MIQSSICHSQIFNNKILQMSQNQKFSFQRQSFADRRFDQGSNLCESSVKDESIKNMTFYSNAKENKEDALKFLVSYKPLDESFPKNELQSSSNFTYKAYKDSNYYGELVNSRKHGWGIMIYKNDKIYQGKWQNDKKNGLGVQKFPNGCVYKGNYADGKPEGEGFYKWSNGQTYRGQWRKGERHGIGTWDGANGQVYEGQWRQGKPNGSGFASSNGDTYQGQFKQSLKNGYGVQKFANGDMYRGNYVNNMPAGEGTYYWADKSYFKGNFINGLRQGKGIWKKGAGKCDKYEGYYKNDKKWGYGQFTWASGNVYKGNYQGDVRSGYGEMYWTNGSFYKGEWVNGVQHGQGQLYIPDIGYKKAFFSNNSIAQVIQEKLINKHRQNKSQGKSQAKSRESEVSRPRQFKSFRSKQKNQKILKNTQIDKAQLRRLPQTQSIQFQKEKFISISAKTPFQRSEKRVRILRQHQKKKTIESEQAKRNFSFFGNQLLRNTGFKSIQIEDNDKNLNNQISWKRKSKQRILHSSFYLYKLNNWNSNKNQQQLSSTHRNSPRYANNFLQH